MRLVVLALALACAAPALPYGQPEILKILFAGIRSRDPQVQKAVVLLRSKGLLEARTASLAKVAAVAESDDVKAALAMLHSKGLLPDAQTSPDALSAYIGQVQALADEEERERTVDRGKRTLLLMGETTGASPYYVYLPRDGAYILGGMVPAGVPVEMTYARPDGFVEVLFPALKRGFLSKDVLRATRPRPSRYRQDPEQTELVCEAPFKAWRASFLGAELVVAQIDMKARSEFVLFPYVTGRYNQIAPGPERVEHIHDVARREDALLAVNGTFFNMSGGALGTPLAPIIIDGATAWSHTEQRVRQMRRSYLAVTESNRCVVGDTSMLSDEILRANRTGRFDPGELRGEKIKHLMGGLGWLIRDGDPDAWRANAGTQFAYAYYSNYVKRPQTVVAVSPSGRRIWIVVQEGLPHSSSPLPLPELARYMYENFKPRHALFLDGGGSSEMVVNGRVLTRAENNGAYRKNSTMLLIAKDE